MRDNQVEILSFVPSYVRNQKLRDRSFAISGLVFCALFSGIHLLGKNSDVTWAFAFAVLVIFMVVFYLHFIERPIPLCELKGIADRYAFANPVAQEKFNQRLNKTGCIGMADFIEIVRLECHVTRLRDTQAVQLA